ncbi:MAG: tetratricopeptide repeat protein [Spirochaetes bacterium]|nr:tetratricopeptide repeat protein [Spirochaetota bacterium]
MRKTAVCMTVCTALVCAGYALLFSQEMVNDLMNNQGVRLGEQNRLDEAIELFDRAIDFREKAAAKAYHNKGFALEKKGELKAAIKYYEEAWRRNPKQVPTGERLGYGLYKTEEYDRAIEVGEAVMRLDPRNTQVPIWLADAYRRRGGKKVSPDKGAAAEVKRHVFYMSIDAMARMGLYYGSKSHYGGLYRTNLHGFRYVPDPGLITSVPYTIFMSITPIPLLQIDLTVENPWLGGVTPPGLVVQTEKGEVLFHIKNFTLGAGFMANHYDDGVAFYRRYKLTDYKVGFIIGYRKDDVEAKITWYPRMLIMDPRSSTGKTLDVGSLRIDYSYQAYPDIKIYGMFHFRDYYVFCHSFDWRVFYASYYRYSENIASYWGVYDMGIGLTFSNLARHEDGTELFSLSVEWVERFYLRDLNNDAPYTLAPNGQGWFGLNLKKFTKGKPFSGFWALSQVLSIRFDEQFTRNFFMYQKFIAELADQDAEHHEFNLQLGMGFKI